MNIKKFYKWIIGIFIGGTIMTVYFGAVIKPTEIPDSLKLKVDKDKILESKDINWIIEKEDGTIDNKGLIKSYDYITDRKVIGNYLFERASYTNTRILSEKETADGTEYTVKSFVGDHFYKDSKGDVYEIEQGATTTVEAFNEQTKETLPEKVSRILFGDKAIAACGDSGGNCYAGAGDGWVGYALGGTLWNTAHDSSNASGADKYPYTEAASKIRIYSGADYARIYRAFFPIDTSAIPDGATITGGVLSLYVTETQNGANDGLDYWTVVQTTQAGNTTLVTGDYNQCGDAVDDPTEGVDSGQRKDISSISTSAYLVITLNSTGYGWIVDDGYTKLGLREGHDTTDYDSGYFAQNYTTFAMSEADGTNTDPYITITYTTGGAEAPKQIKIPPQMIIN